MIKNNILFRTLIVFLLLLASVTLLSQEKTKKTDSPPVEGQAGKNVPWITTPQILVDKMLDLAK